MHRQCDHWPVSNKYDYENGGEKERQFTYTNNCNILNGFGRHSEVNQQSQDGRFARLVKMRATGRVIELNAGFLGHLKTLRLFFIGFLIIMDFALVQ